MRSTRRTPILLAAPAVGAGEINAAVRVLRSGNLAQGAEVAAFEAEFSAQVAGRHAIAVSSGTTALHLALLALGVSTGHEVIVPSFTFGATAHAVALTGARPIFADIDPATLCLDPDHVDQLVTSRTSAVVAVHLFGHPATMPDLITSARRHGLAVIEDAAQAVAAELHKVPMGAWGDLACFSFYPTKNMHSIEGGMVTTADAALAARLRLLRNQVMTQPFDYQTIGLNGRMTDVAAAVGRVQLAALPARTEARRANAAYLTRHLHTVTTPVTADGAAPAFHQYVVRSTERDTLATRLRQDGITTAVHYPIPVHRTAAYRVDTALPHTELAAAQVLSLPVHPGLSDADLARIVEAANQ